MRPRLSLVSNSQNQQLDGEAQLEDMLDDPVLLALMQRDGVTRQALLDLVAGIRSRRWPERRQAA